jgi:DegT/DnrJ/EryC1/StrS aminotransferase family
MRWFVYVVRLAPGVDRRSVVDGLAADGIPTRVYFPRLHLQRYIREMLGTYEGMLPVTEYIAERTFALSFHNNLVELHVEQAVDAPASGSTWSTNPTRREQMRRGLLGLRAPLTRRVHAACRVVRRVRIADSLLRSGGRLEPGPGHG